MPTFVMLSQILPGSVKSSSEFKETASKVRQMIEAEVPEAKWVCSYALMGRFDVIDIFEAPSMQHAATVSAIVRFHGKAHTETLLANDWKEFVTKAGSAKG